MQTSIRCLASEIGGFLASSSRPKTSEGGLGEYMVHRNVRDYGVCSCDAVLQARHKVRLACDFLIFLAIFICQ